MPLHLGRMCRLSRFGLSNRVRKPDQTRSNKWTISETAFAPATAYQYLLPNTSKQSGMKKAKIYLSIYLSICLSVSVCQSIRPFIHLSIHLSIYLSIYLSSLDDTITFGYCHWITIGHNVIGV